MFRSRIKKTKRSINNILKKPFYVFMLCLAFLTISLVFDGTLFQIFRLSRDVRILDNRIKLFTGKNELIKQKIKNSSQSEFIKKEALERLDFVHEGDLIFIFPEGN